MHAGVMVPDIDRTSCFGKFRRGELTERLKVLDSKSSVSARAPWVRIPCSPPVRGSRCLGLDGSGTTAVVPIRRGDRVVEGARLELVCVGNGTEGSNPSLSAAQCLLWDVRRTA